MGAQWPGEPIGPGRLEAWCRKLLRACQSVEIRPGPNYKVSTSPSGTVLTIDPRGGNGTGSGMNYKGTYDDSLSYAVGDVVRVKDGALGPLGVWICVKAAAAASPPVWPEPKDADPNAQNTWELLTFGPKEYTGCKGGVDTTFYLNMYEA